MTFDAIIQDEMTWYQFRCAFEAHAIVNFLGGSFVIVELHNDHGKRTAKVVQVLPVILPHHPPEKPA